MSHTGPLRCRWNSPDFFVVDHFVILMPYPRVPYCPRRSRSESPKKESPNPRISYAKNTALGTTRSTICFLSDPVSPVVAVSSDPRRIWLLSLAASGKGTVKLAHY
jgi:hypothetical protein